MSEEKNRKHYLRKRFDAKCLGVVKYARSHMLTQSTLSNVLDAHEEISGKKNNITTGMTRKIYLQLKCDGIWIGALPWES